MWTKNEILTHLLRIGEISLSRLIECVENDSKYNEEIKIQNKKLNEKKELLSE